MAFLFGTDPTVLSNYHPSGSAGPQGLFNAASVACQDQQHTKCFVGFSLFRERFPELVEGYSNAGVALERMGRLEDAKAIYRKALEKFPGAEKAVGPLLNVLQVGCRHGLVTFRGAPLCRLQILTLSPRPLSLLGSPFRS